MLHFVREHARSKVIQVMLLAIVGVFVFWGVQAVVSGVNARTTAAWVDGTPIEAIEVSRAEYNMLQSFRRMAGDALTPDFMRQLNIRQRSLDELIDRRLLLAQARELGLEISDKEVADVIVAAPSFQADGRFNPEVYRRALRGARLAPAEFEETQRENLLVGRLQAIVEDGIMIPEAEARAELLAREEKRSLDFVKIAFSDHTEGVAVEPQALAAWYEKHGKDFEEPEKAEIELVAFGPEDFTEGIVVEEGAIAAAYEAAKELRFTQAEGRRARHILVPMKRGASKDESKAAREKMRGFAERIEKGEDFAAVAEEGSEDPGSRDKGGDLGFFERGRMVRPFEDAVWELEVGEVSEIVETPFGLHLIKLEEIRDARTRELDEVREQITSELRRQKAVENAGVAAKATHAEIKDGKNLAQVAEAGKLDVSRPGALARNATLPGIGSAFPVWEKLWAAEAGATVEPIQAGETWVIARLVKKIPAHVPPLAAVRERAEGAYRRERAEAKVVELASALLAEARKAGSLATAAKATGQKVETTKPFDAEGSHVEEIGGVPDLKQIVFGLTREKPLPEKTFVFGGDAFVVALDEIETPAADEDFTRKVETTRTEMEEATRREVFAAYVKDLKLKAKIEIDRQVIDALPEAR